ncbi:MAG TPA: hypothetical protein VGP52_12690 [Stellaceae bacterium]|jgi:hypothetical protein|nr:hypothetical protein [Stellaceae bacterium]
MHRVICRGIAAAAVAAFLPGAEAMAHGFAGDRFFPATILTDDPFVADEASLPTISLNPTQSDGSRELDVGSDLSMLITPSWDFTLSDQWAHLRAPGMPATTGFGALTTGTQYQLFINPEHEAMALAALDVTWGNTGNVQNLGAPAFTTLSPTFDFGKGFGDLPNSLPWLRPFALTGNIALDVPTQTETMGVKNPDDVFYGFAIEYSIPYLQEEVRDVGLGPPFNRMIPLVEFALTSPFNRGYSGTTTGTVQPGVIWAGQYFQVGAEAIIPTNSLSGHGIGGVIQLHFYLDDLFPNSIGRPISQW